MTTPAMTGKDRAMHTPGPWVVARSFRGVYSEHPSPGPVQVCRAPEHFHDRWNANARLIAAAPDLLNALTVLADACASMGIPVDAARAAIAKATGATL